MVWRPGLEPFLHGRSNIVTLETTGACGQKEEKIGEEPVSTLVWGGEGYVGLLFVCHPQLPARPPFHSVPMVTFHSHGR